MSEHDDLDLALRSIRFRPRESLEPERLGRVRRGESPPAPRTRGGRSGGLWATGAAAALALGGLRGDRSAAEVTVDRCCYDLDGGGRDDDALLVMGVPPDRVMMAAVYERPADGDAPPDPLPLR